MTQMTYPNIRQALNGFSAEKSVAYQPFDTKVILDETDEWLGAWSNKGMHVLVHAAMAPDAPRRTLFDIHAGGAYGLTPSLELFETLSQSNLRLNFGGPWCRRQKDDKVAFGWQVRFPSELVHDENYAEAFGLIEGTIWDFGRLAGEMAQELIPLHGGAPIRADDPNAWTPLLSGLLPRNQPPTSS